MQTNPMIPGAFVLKLKTRNWRLCVVKQVPKLSSSCWMLFGQGTNQGTNQGKTTFQMEFQSCQETTLINHLVNMAADAEETQVRLVLVRDAPAVSCIESLWSLKGHEMYRKQLRTASALINSLHQDMNMLCISPEQQQPPQPPQQQPESKSRHHMKTRSQTR
jgi:hypothetical protein